MAWRLTIRLLAAADKGACFCEAHQLRGGDREGGGEGKGVCKMGLLGAIAVRCFGRVLHGESGRDVLGVEMRSEWLCFYVLVYICIYVCAVEFLRLS